MIYLLECDNYYKIGYASNLNTRLKHYDTHNPNYKLIDSKEGSQQDETCLHRLCHNFLVKGEWFCKNDDVLKIWNQFTPKNQKTHCTEIHFFDVFYESFYNLQSNLCKNLLMWFLNKSINNIIHVSASSRKDLCIKFGTSNNAITNCLKLLRDNKFLIGKDGKFLLNPYFVWKGDIKSRIEYLEYWDNNLVP